MIPRWKPDFHSALAVSAFERQPSDPASGIRSPAAAVPGGGGLGGQRLHGNEPAVQTQFAFREPEGQAHQLREVNRGNPGRFPAFGFHLVVVAVQIELAEGAVGHYSFCSGRLCRFDHGVDHFARYFWGLDRQVGTATLVLVGKVDGCGTQGNHQIV